MVTVCETLTPWPRPKSAPLKVVAGAGLRSKIMSACTRCGTDTVTTSGKRPPIIRATGFETFILSRPPRRRSSRPRSQAPRGILDCSRQLAASRSSPPNGHPAPPSVGMCWIFAGRAPRSRSDNLIISTTQQHAALPYQGRGHWRPKMQSASMMRAMRARLCRK